LDHYTDVLNAIHTADWQSPTAPPSLTSDDDAALIRDGFVETAADVLATLRDAHTALVNAVCAEPSTGSVASARNLFGFERAIPDESRGRCRWCATITRNTPNRSPIWFPTGPPQLVSYSRLNREVHPVHWSAACKGSIETPGERSYRWLAGRIPEQGDQSLERARYAAS